VEKVEVERKDFDQLFLKVEKVEVEGTILINFS
jgi:hypothetical protein